LNFERRGPCTDKIVNAVVALTKSNGAHPFIYRDLKSYVVGAGLADITERVVSIPVGEWGGNIGSLFKEDIDTGFRGFKSHLMKILGCSSNEYDTLVKNAMDECEKKRSYVNFIIVIGRKV